MKSKPEISDAAKRATDTIWCCWPGMRPVGLSRQAKHLAMMDDILTSIEIGTLLVMIRVLKADPYRRQWVADIEQIAERLPRIKAVLEDKPPCSLANDSFLARQQRGEI